MTEVFAFEWCSCIYEAGFSVQTLHTTKRGALKAMIECVNHRWQVQRDLQLERGGWAKGERRDPLWDEAWRVRAIPLYNDLGNRRDAGPIGGASVLSDGLAGKR